MKISANFAIIGGNDSGKLIPLEVRTFLLSELAVASGMIEKNKMLRECVRVLKCTAGQDSPHRAGARIKLSAVVGAPYGGANELTYERSFTIDETLSLCGPQEWIARASKAPGLGCQIFANAMVAAGEHRKRLEESINSLPQIK